MIEFARNGNGFLVIDRKRGVQFELTRAEGKALARFLMLELNIWDFRIRQGDEIYPVHDEEYFKLRDKRWK